MPLTPYFWCYIIAHFLMSVSSVDHRNFRDLSLTAFRFFLSTPDRLQQFHSTLLYSPSAWEALCSMPSIDLTFRYRIFLYRSRAQNASRDRGDFCCHWYCLWNGLSLSLSLSLLILQKSIAGPSMPSLALSLSIVAGLLVPFHLLVVIFLSDLYNFIKTVAYFSTHSADVWCARHVW